MPRRGITLKAGLKSVLACAVLLAGSTGITFAVAPPAAANGPCVYHTREAAEVRENPSINSVVRKTVPAGYRVTGPVAWNGCVSTTGSDGRQWVPVDCTCTSQGYGYIIANKLGP